MDEDQELIWNSLKRVEKWVEDHDYRGYEPFDGLSCFLRPLTFGNLLLDRLLLQLIRQSPINLRPFLGIKPLDSTKGRGYMAAGYIKMFKLTREQLYEVKAYECLDWLINNKAPGYKHFSWANHFDFASRSGRCPKHEPIIVWTSLIGQAFLDAYCLWQKEKYLDVADSACKWIAELPREKTQSGACISYVAYEQESVHNANMLGAALLARTGRIVGNAKYCQIAREAMAYSCSRQLSNGAWYYGEAPNQRWIDNFHTGYNLDSLRYYTEAVDDEFIQNLKRGLSYFEKTFFDSRGTPKYYHSRTYPVDIQCASQAIETLSCMSEYSESSFELAIKVARWTIKNMQDPKGHFYYRRYPLLFSKTPMLHWGQATMYKSLSTLLLTIEESNQT